MPQSPEILFVDDDRVMRKKYHAVFAAEGFAVREAKNGEEALAAFAERRPDVVVLDVMMPKMNGLDACRAIRARDAAVPILFLSCVPEDTKKLRAYDLGADDYVEKGTNDDVLVAKVRALLRRVAAPDASSASGVAASAAVSPPASVVADRIRLGLVEVDFKNLEVLRPKGVVERLTKTESDILKILVAHRGQALTRDELISRLRGEGFACEDALLYSHVSRLRKKLGPAASLLTSARDAGYRLLR